MWLISTQVRTCGDLIDNLPECYCVLGKSAAMGFLHEVALGCGEAGGSSPLSAMPIYRSRGLKELERAHRARGPGKRGLQDGCDAASCAWGLPLHCASTQTTRRGPGIAMRRQAPAKQLAPNKC